MMMIIFEKLLIFFLSRLPPEYAHKSTLLLLRVGLNKRKKIKNNFNLKTRLFGFSLSNPVGLAAGFDKNAEALKGLLKLNFGFIEVGTVTPKPQTGNEKPRVFRLKKNKSLINSLGFPNKGAAKVYENIMKIRNKHKLGQEPLIGINIGCNKNSSNPIDDYLFLLEKFYLVADYITINISSPNTPGLRDFHKKEKLDELLRKIKDKALSLKRKTSYTLPLAIKISPDLKLRELTILTKTVINYKFDAIIATNTSINKDLFLDKKYYTNKGGISGKSLFEYSNKTLKNLKKISRNKITIIASGGVNDWISIKDKISLGAKAVQIYTGLVYEGPSMISKSLELLSNYLKKEKISNISKLPLSLK